MIRNYLLIFFRLFKRQRTHTIINIAGLAMGLAAAMLITLYIHDELRFNSMHPHPDRTFRLAWEHTNNNGNTQAENTVFGSWSRRMKDELPEVEQVTRVLHVSFPTNVRNKATDKSILTDDRKWIDSAFPEVLALKIVKGTKEGFFSLPNTMILSESAAKEFFGEEDPIGQVLTINDRGATDGKDSELMITAVYKDFPLNSTFRIKYLFNIESLRPMHPDFNDIMERESFETYVLLREGVSEQKVADFLQKLSEEKQKEFSEWASKISPVFIRLPDLHFNLQTTWDYTGTTGNKIYLTVLSVIALLILIIACINYMNLATAKTAIRAREVGIRKSFGSSRKKLAGQFMLESVIMAGVAFIISFVLATSFLPLFNSLALKQFKVNDLLRPDIFLIFSGIAAFAALAGGAYPAFILSGFKPIVVLKGRVGESGAGQFFRKSLVTIQYAVSISLTIIAIVILKQVDLMHHSKLNEKGDQIMMIRFGSTMKYGDFFTLKNELLKDPGIEVVSVGDAFPRLDHWGIAELDVTAPELSDQKLKWNQLLVDYDFSRTFNLPVMAGRNFEQGNNADSLNVLVNQAAVQSLGLTADKVIGANLTLNLGTDRNGSVRLIERKIIGIIQDFPYRNMKQDIQPLILNPNPNLAGYSAGTMVYVKLPEGQIQEKLDVVQKGWKKLFPDAGIQYYFVNDLFGRLYKSELTMSKLALNFSVLAILITMFGLFGLASYSAERRTKEIGVRKVHGATVWQITQLMMSSFLRIFIIASVIVVPLDYFVLREWLSVFRYQTTLDISVFAMGLGLIFLVTIITVSYETIKAAVVNPVKSLRYE